ncbi:MAG: hypothetical protein AAGL11_07020 [Pseudomonadota bacterium]
MASDFDNIRSNLRQQQQAPERSSGQLGFIIALVAVIALGGVIGYLALPKDSAPRMSSASETAPAAKAVSKSDLKEMRRAELNKYRETQVTLLQCVKSQRSMESVYKAYLARNASLRQAWYEIDSPMDRLNKLTEMNQLEATAYMMTRGRDAQRDLMSDIEADLGSARMKIDPIKCGQLNAQVQRRELDLKPIPLS